MRSDKRSSRVFPFRETYPEHCLHTTPVRSLSHFRPFSSWSQLKAAMRFPLTRHVSRVFTGGICEYSRYGLLVIRRCGEILRANRNIDAEGVDFPLKKNRLIYDSTAGLHRHIFCLRDAICEGGINLNV